MRRLPVTISVLAAVVLATSLSAAAPRGAAGPGALTSVVVVSKNGAAVAAREVRALGGSIESTIDLVGGVVARVGRRDAARLEARPGVSVTPDYRLTFQDASYADAPPSIYPQSIGATKLWDTGVTGEGVGVALLDTGIADHPDLAGRVAASADLTLEGTFSDSYGHGTFLAGLIAGDGASSRGLFTGVAPDAHLVSVKVAGADGTTTLGQVLYGLQLIASSKDAYNIRVVTIALAGPAVPGPDPLVLAVERLWADGMTVVVAAGNTGPAAGSIASPAVDPYVLTVGGTSENGTASPADDFVAEWSSRGPSVYGMPKPDLVAPGTSLVSLRVPGSTIDETHPGARVGATHFRGSGTSMSAAVASGAAALLLQSNPALTPDEVKGRVMGSAVPLVDADRNAAGAGALDVAAAASSNAPAGNRDLPPLPRGGSVIAPADPFPGGSDSSFVWSRNPQGGADRWLARRWADEEWSARRWAGGEWAARRWAGADWSARDWAARRWAGRDWAGSGWAARRWAGADWSARRWAGAYWASFTWAAAGWH